MTHGDGDPPDGIPNKSNERRNKAMTDNKQYQLTLNYDEMKTLCEAVHDAYIEYMGNESLTEYGDEVARLLRIRNMICETVGYGFTENYGGWED